MKVSDFAVKVTQNEGLKKEVNIAQVKEILRVINALTFGGLYKLIKTI